jgi:hypothetical protein
LHKRQYEIAGTATARKIITLVLGIILLSVTVTSLYSSSSFFINNAQAQFVVNVEDLDCDNININGNNIYIDSLPAGLADLIQSEAGDNSNSNNEQRFIENFLYKCINNNQNQFNETQNPISSPPVITPPPTPVNTETLTVIKNIECQADVQTC